MSRRWRCRSIHGDEGVSLVLALVFILIVGLFSTVALTKSQATLTSGQAVRDRGQLQYDLDGGVDRAIQVMQSDMANPDPAACAQSSASTGSGTLTLNATTTSWSCTLLAGRAKKSTDSTNSDYAIIVTSPNSGALTTQSGSGTFDVGGSIYLNGAVQNSDINTHVNVTGDIVSPSSDPSCSANLALMTNVAVTATTFLKTCTEQSESMAEPMVSLIPAPTVDISTSYSAGLPAAGGCRVYFPGLYKDNAPSFSNGDNYMVSGLYYFNSVAVSLNSNSLTLIGGARSASTDSPALTGSCAGMTDTVALNLLPAAVHTALTGSGYTFPSGVTWVLGGSAAVTVPKATVTLFSPPRGSSSQPMSIVAYKTATNGYTAIASGVPTVFSGGTNNTKFLANGKIFASSARIDLTATGSSAVQQALGGMVGYQIALKASTPAFGTFNVSVPGGVGTPPPPFRTVKVVSTASGNTAQNTAVLTISNFPLNTVYTVKIKSWRTS